MLSYTLRSHVTWTWTCRGNCSQRCSFGNSFSSTLASTLASTSTSSSLSTATSTSQCFTIVARFSYGLRCYTFLRDPQRFLFSRQYHFVTSVTSLVVTRPDEQPLNEEVLEDGERTGDPLRRLASHSRRPAGALRPMGVWQLLPTPQSPPHPGHLGLPRPRKPGTRQRSRGRQRGVRPPSRSKKRPKSRSRGGYSNTAQDPHPQPQPQPQASLQVQHHPQSHPLVTTDRRQRQRKRRPSSRKPGT